MGNIPKDTETGGFRDFLNRISTTDITNGRIFMDSHKIDVGLLSDAKALSWFGCNIN